MGAANRITNVDTETPNSLGGGLFGMGNLSPYQASPNTMNTVANASGMRMDQREYDLANPNTRNDMDYVGIGGLGTQPMQNPLNPYDLNNQSPIGSSNVGYGNFRLNPSSGGKNYNTAFDVATGDSDYTKAAKVQAQGNLAAAQAQSSANRVNQINPYGSINYYQSGVDSAGNPTYSAAASLAPEQQALLNAQNYQSMGLAQTANQALNNVYNTYGQSFNADPYMQQMLGAGPQFNQIGQAANLQSSLDQNAGMQGWDRASNLLMSRLNPQIEQGQDRLRAQLANQGIVAGTKAYDRAMTLQGQQENDLRTQAQIAGSQLQNQLFGQELQAGQFGNQALTQQNVNQLANLGFNNQLGQQGFQNQLAGQQANNMARQNNFQLASYLRGLPMQELNALRAGSQVTNPSFINVAQQGQTQGPDTLSAYQAQQNANIAAQNRQAAQSNNLTSGLFDLGGSILGNLGGVKDIVGSIGSGIGNAVSGIGKMFSDIRMKENIKHTHWLPNGLPVYTYEYKPEFKDLAGHGVHIGVMAQEVAQVVPEAVSMQENGYMMVDYSKLL